jgi:glucosamine-6-phosphate deaminase
MHKYLFPTKLEMARAAAEKAAEIINESSVRNGHATFVAATGASQFEFLDALISDHKIDWSKTTMFHLDEYIGLPETHPASFRRYLKERLIERVNPHEVYLINGDTDDPGIECQRLNKIIAGYKIDIAFVGIGENGHLAFNDPPADFEIEDPYIVVQLDDQCRRQQLGEGWFDKLEDVPHQAISMSIKQIMRAQAIICVVPDRRKQQGVIRTLTGEISPMNPASILRESQNAHIFLDADSARLVNHLRT